jgi:hypothetical protein
VRTLLTGLAIACSMHAAWNAAAGTSSLTMFAIALGAFVMLAVCVIKARQISPERSQLVASQILGAPVVTPAAARPALRPQGPLDPHTGMAPASLAGSVGGHLTRAAEQPPGSITWDDDAGQRIVEIGSARIPAAVGARIWERQAPGAVSSRGDGVVGEVSANPNDVAVLGLKNLSSQPWPVTLPSGQQRELAPGRSIRLEPGMRLVIGDLVAVVR